MPDSLTEYAHRIGRTARIDHPGRSVIVLFEKVKFLIKEVKFLDKLN
jgi:superfamily II DNA/RNA helicase